MQHRTLLLSPATASEGTAFTIQVLTRPTHTREFDLEMGSLAFALLREDHIIVAADRRHTRGDFGANYKNDSGFKTMTILSKNGVLGFAGHDIGEQILIPAKQEGKLDGSSLKTVASALRDFAKVRYEELEPDFRTMLQPPSVEFMLAGFDVAEEGMTATAYTLSAPDFPPRITQFPFQKFEVIGRRTHGALYALHRFGEQAQTVDAGLGLAAFVLAEITECDTTIGGLPKLYVIPKGNKAVELDTVETSKFAEWAKTTGLELAKALLLGPSSTKP